MQLATLNTSNKVACIYICMKMLAESRDLVFVHVYALSMLACLFAMTRLSAFVDGGAAVAVATAATQNNY